MRVISQRKIRDFYTQQPHEGAKVPLRQWYHTVRNRDYRSFSQILVDFRDAVREGDLYVFSIDNGTYKVVTSIFFDTGCIYVRSVVPGDDTLANEQQ